MTNELIEAMAQAIHDAEKEAWIRGGGTWIGSKPEARHYEQARAAHSATEAAGYRLVPVEPTPEMMAAYHRASIAPVSSLSLHGYRAMLAAAPNHAAGVSKMVPGWVSVEERLPEDMRPVLALYRNESNLQRIVRAIYVQRMAWERCYDDGLDDYGDYDPETDQHYWPAGWYECAENAEHLYVMSEAVTQWMPMPPAPEPDHAENVLNLIRQTQGMNRDE